MGTRGIIKIINFGLDDPTLIYNHFDSSENVLGSRIKDALAILCDRKHFNSNDIIEKLGYSNDDIVERIPYDIEYIHEIDLPNNTYSISKVDLISDPHVEKEIYFVNIDSLKINQKEILDKVILKWKDAQKPIIIEELSELITALLHYERKKISKQDLISEVADVEIVLKQLKIIYDISTDKVEETKREKLLRVLKRVDSE